MPFARTLGLLPFFLKKRGLRARSKREAQSISKVFCKNFAALQTHAHPYYTPFARAVFFVKKQVKTRLRRHCPCPFFSRKGGQSVPIHRVTLSDPVNLFAVFFGKNGQAQRAGVKFLQFFSENQISRVTRVSSLMPPSGRSRSSRNNPGVFPGVMLPSVSSKPKAWAPCSVAQRKSASVGT